VRKISTNERSTTMNMNYVKPQLLNVKKASSAILGAKPAGPQDNDSGSNQSTNTAFRSDE
jgi:hypothetical protein